MRAQTVRWRIARRHLSQPRSYRFRWLIALALVAALLFSGVSAATAMYVAAQLPRAQKFRIHYSFQDAHIYDFRGNLLYNMADLRKNGGQRVVEPLQGRHDDAPPCRNGVNRIPRRLQNATIATEDATFYGNPGFDALSMLRAAYQNWKSGHVVSGASTITQQIVRSNLLNNSPTLGRKAEEVAIAYEIAKRFSKRQILWYYLNSVPYGNLTYGAQAAAHFYFQEPVCDLDLAQAALLAGLPRAPTLYDPVRHHDRAIARMHTVLKLMLEHGYLDSPSQIAQALHEARGWRFYAQRAQLRDPAFVRYVINQLQTMPTLRARLYQGLDIYTTVDPQVQDLAQSTVANQIDSLKLQHVTDGALVSLDLRPQHYGWILAMVGSAHDNDPWAQINMSTTPRQPGSSMKPFNYVWAFTHGGVGPGTSIEDTPIRLPDPHNVSGGGWYDPVDYDGRFHGRVTLREALANSLNVPAVKLEYYITGMNHIAATAADFGMSSIYRDNPHLDCGVCYSLTLGGLTKGTRLLEETAAYGVFATSGWTVPPIAIWKVVRRSTGQTIWCSADCPRGVKPVPWIRQWRKQAVDAGHAYQITDVLSDNDARCSPHVCEFGSNSPLLLSHPAAAKTGTTNAMTDNLTLGYTPQIVTGVWTGNADRSPMINVIGLTGAAPIWHDFMEGAFQILKLPPAGFSEPPEVVRTSQCQPGASSYLSIGTADLTVNPGISLPLCQVQERGFMPVPCSQYPSTPGFTPQCNQTSPYSSDQYQQSSEDQSNQ